ncbi:hypothetical protein [Arcticibacterium luteifluviistationis]|uniref:Uncharacterized protein n=1 Tax=Arcticibacterium luteifluviistationis TaxID=1784714 RepID=A0A2Z4G6V0_9BACT|nr:hypothetical protein [Arcticibacterium luteifluviistationis]AWV96803.1 hypothetical protein DJ013_00815 [Arcticibacterium luteifluviistationis]
MKKEPKYAELIKNHDNLMNRLEQYGSKWFIFRNSKITIWEAFQIKGWYEFFINENLDAAKQAFYDCSKIDIYYYQKLIKPGGDLFSAGRTHVLQTALSDSKDLMKEYNLIDYPVSKRKGKILNYSDLVQEGKTYIYCDLINKAMNQEIDKLANLVEIVKEKTLDKKKNEWLRIDLQFFEGIINKEKDIVLDVVKQLCTTEHKRRNKHSWFYKDLVSQPAQGYAKIAWLNGLQIEIENDFVYNEFLPTSPMKEYDDNAKELISKMTLESNVEFYNGQKLSEDEYKQLYS